MPRALAADDTSVHRMSTLGKQTNTISAMDSFQEPENFRESQEDPQRAPSVVDSAEYGMPMTEDADNMPTMAQLHLNFGLGESSNA